MANTYRSRSLQVQAVQFTGANMDDLRTLAPLDTVSYEPARGSGGQPDVLIYAPGRPTRVLHEGDWVVWDGVYLSLVSDRAFGAHWERVSE